jgi:hypothetical protein
MTSPNPTKHPQKWHDRLAARWELKSKWDFWWIFIGFAFSGSLSGGISTWIIVLLHAKDQFSFWQLLMTKVLLLIIIYPPVLLTVGSFIGQYPFFSKFLRRMFTWKKSA